MTKKTSLKLVFISLFISLTLILAFAAGMGSKEGDVKETSAASLTAEETVDIVKDGQSDYAILFSVDDAFQTDADIAKELSTLIRRAYGPNIRYKADTSTEITAHEILIGVTNRIESTAVNLEVEQLTNDNNLVYIIAEKNEKLVFIANCNEAYAKGADVFYELLGEESFSIAKDMKITFVMSRADYDQELADKENAEREQKLQEITLLHHSTIRSSVKEPRCPRVFTIFPTPILQRVSIRDSISPQICCPT